MKDMTDQCIVNQCILMPH